MDAGRQLASHLEVYRNDHAVVLGLPRGGVVVGSPVAARLASPFDIIAVRKLGAPGRQELGIGAIAEHRVKVLNQDLVRHLRITDQELATVEESEQSELVRRVEMYRRGLPEVDLEDRLAIIVDDGLATGYTARAAVLSARARKAGRVIVAIPVAAPDTLDELSKVADGVVAVSVPDNFQAVGLWYRDFAQVTDREVLNLLSAARTSDPTTL